MPSIRADSPVIQRYYAMLKEAEGQEALHEGNVRRAFEALLRETARDLKGWELVTEVSERRENNAVRYDGTLRDGNRLPHGWWEAKDSQDDLDTEIRKKRDRGYRFDNIIFEDTREAVLYQNNLPVQRADLRQAEALAELLNRFYAHEIEPFTRFEQAVAYFQNEIPHIAVGLKQRIEAAHDDNRPFQAAYRDFMELCKTALNPNISRAAVDEMLIQHMLTERLIRKVFDVEEFNRRNVIAAEVENVIDSLASQHFNRREFLGALDRFYTAIEEAADRLATFSEKQDFINHVYERFFQGYSVKIADTHGIVYTPQPIVDFMCAAVEEVLLTEFGKKLGDDGVYVIDPCTGTGNFVVNLLRRAQERNPREFEKFYKYQLFANEVMLMPYYIASLNIEHEYYALSGKYEPFEGICFVDTLDLSERVDGQMELKGFLTERNTARVERQKQAPITVIIGNPPYNVGQLNENDNNKNRKYEVIDKRVAETYAKDSKATNKNALSDPYVKFFRWASDRLQGRDGIVCYVSNNSFVDQIAFDGMRKHLLDDFTDVYHLDLHGNVRQNPKLSGTTHNVFGIQVGVGVTVAVRKTSQNPLPTSLIQENPHPTSPKHGGGERARLTPLPVFGEGLGVGSNLPALEEGPGVGSTAHTREQSNPLPTSPKYGGGVNAPADSAVIPENGGGARLRYHRVPEFWTRQEKLEYLTYNVIERGKQNALNTVEWQTLKPDNKHTWLVPENADEFASFLPMGSKETKSAKDADVEAIFKMYSGGVKTNRDEVVYDFNRPALIERVKKFIEDYNAEVDRYNRAGRPNNVDDFVKYDRIKWSEGLKVNLKRGKYGKFSTPEIRPALYRPFNKQYFYFDDVLNERRYQFPSIYPTPATEQENRVICLPGIGNRAAWACLIADCIPNLTITSVDGFQCFPFYVYDEDGNNRRENITDWALAQFRARYAPLPVLGEGLGVGSNPLPASPKHGGGVNAPDPLGWAVKPSPKELYEKIKPLARQMRKEPTPAEHHLWQRIRHKRVLGYKFRRQHPIDRFIVDFYCAEARLVIEVDGAIHEYQQEDDALRQAYLESLGLRVLRFTNGEVLQQTDGVVERIAEVLQESEDKKPQPQTEQGSNQPHPQPLPEYREGSQTASDSSPMLGGGREGVVMREITKWDIFYYVYGLLHHPEYRRKFADNLKRELPRIPFVPTPNPSPLHGEGSPAAGFWAFADAGRKLAELHLNYETIEPYKLEWVTTAGKPVSYRVEKMRLLGKSEAQTHKVYEAIQINDTLTLKGIPAEAFEYRLGNRSALEWIVDQYQVSTDKRSGITSDPNGYSDNERYIVELVERVARVSVETARIVRGLPGIA